MSKVHVTDQRGGVFRMVIEFTYGECERLPYNAMRKIKARIDQVPNGGISATAEFSLRNPRDAANFVEALDLFGVDGSYVHGSPADATLLKQEEPPADDDVPGIRAATTESAPDMATGSMSAVSSPEIRTPAPVAESEASAPEAVEEESEEEALAPSLPPQDETLDADYASTSFNVRDAVPAAPTAETPIATETDTIQVDEIETRDESVSDDGGFEGEIEVEVVSPPAETGDVEVVEEIIEEVVDENGDPVGSEDGEVEYEYETVDEDEIGSGDDYEVVEEVVDDIAEDGPDAAAEYEEIEYEVEDENGEATPIGEDEEIEYIEEVIDEGDIGSDDDYEVEYEYEEVEEDEDEDDQPK